jgi:hypothetical protein
MNQFPRERALTIARARVIEQILEKIDVPALLTLPTCAAIMMAPQNAIICEDHTVISLMVPAGVKRRACFNFYFYLFLFLFWMCF